jgi:hypothetical protein
MRSCRSRRREPQSSHEVLVVVSRRSEPHGDPRAGRGAGGSAHNPRRRGTSSSMCSFRLSGESGPEWPMCHPASYPVRATPGGGCTAAKKCPDTHERHEGRRGHAAENRPAPDMGRWSRGNGRGRRLRRALHLHAAVQVHGCSDEQSSHRTRKRPWTSSPRRRNARNSRSMKWGSPIPSVRGRCGERVEVLVHDPVEDRVGSGARDVGSHGGGPCVSFASPPFEMVNGNAKAIFDGSSLTPQPIPEGGGSFFFCEVGAFMLDIIDGSAPARAGVRLGIDPD